MLTRSKARALAVASEHTRVVVTPSGTRQGVHTRWIYPPGSLASPSPPSRVLDSDATSISPFDQEIPSQLGSWSSGSSLSTLSDSSLSSLSDNSFHTAPLTFHIPSTPPPLTPKKLQRSPANQRWAQEGTSWRLTLVPDSFSPEDAVMQEKMIQRQTDAIYNREFAVLIAARKRAQQALGITDFELLSDEMDVDDGGSRRVFIREDTEPAEERDIYPSQQPPRLGPHGTELIDHDSFMAEVPVYPPAWVRAMRMPRWQPTEEVIN